MKGIMRAKLYRLMLYHSLVRPRAQQVSTAKVSDLLHSRDYSSDNGPAG